MNNTIATQTVILERSIIRWWFIGYWSAAKTKLKPPHKIHSACILFSMLYDTQNKTEEKKTLKKKPRQINEREFMIFFVVNIYKCLVFYVVDFSVSIRSAVSISQCGETHKRSKWRFFFALYKTNNNYSVNSTVCVLSAQCFTLPTSVMSNEHINYVCMS